MNIHHLNCGTMRVYQRTDALAVCHCLLVETPGSLLLVDSGVGTRDMLDPARLGPMHLLLNLRRDEAETALHQVRALGYRPEDVRDIIITHLDLDHTGGIPDFPWARIHVLRSELETAMHPRTFRERKRYRTEHLGGPVIWVTHERPSSEKWYGLDCIRGLEGLPDDICLVPLPGHTRGHCGVAVKTNRGWLLHAGDAYFHHRQMASPPKTPLQFVAFQYFAHMDYQHAMRTKRLLLKLSGASRGEVDMFSAHDPGEYSQFAP